MSEPYDPQTAIQKIRSILSKDGRLVITSHCQARMSKRSVDKLDIIKVLEENGIIKSNPEFDNERQKWKYKVDGFDIEGDELSVVVNIVEEDWGVITITVL